MKDFSCVRITQAGWMGVAVFALIVLMSLATDTFLSQQNIYNISRNFSYVGLVALGQAVVLLCGGIDLSVGSVMGLAAIVAAQALEGGGSIYFGFMCGLGVAVLCGLVNGILVSVLGLSPFIATLGMLSIARSLALVLAGNKMIYSFGAAEQNFLELGGGDLLHIPNSVWVLAATVLVLNFYLSRSVWGRHLYAIGGNEKAAVLAGIKVTTIKISAYIISAFFAGLTGILMVGWLGSATTALGTGYELTVIAAAVIGGVKLIGGYGSAYGPIIGAALVEIIRNMLLLLGVDPYWQGTFVGAVIILAVLLQTIKQRENEVAN